MTETVTNNSPSKKYTNFKFVEIASVLYKQNKTLMHYVNDQPKGPHCVYQDFNN